MMAAARSPQNLRAASSFALCTLVLLPVLAAGVRVLPDAVLPNAWSAVSAAGTAGVTLVSGETLSGAVSLSLTATYEGNAPGDDTTRTVFNFNGLEFRINPSPITVGGVSVRNFADVANNVGGSTRCSEVRVRCGRDALRCCRPLGHASCASSPPVRR